MTDERAQAPTKTRTGAELLPDSSHPRARGSYVAWALPLGLALTACTGGDPPRGDASFDSVSPVDASDTGPGPASCPGPAVEDLAAIGTPLEASLGTGLRYEGDNQSAPDDLGSALQPGTPACEFRSVAQRLFRYTLRTEGALRVSTNNPGSEAGFDSTLFVAPYPCVQPLRVYGCNDDDPTAPPDPHVTLSMVTTPVLAAGTTVLVAVSGFYPAAGAGQPPNPDGVYGHFVLTARELPATAVGQACTVNDPERVCAAGSTCTPEHTGGVSARCVRDGSVAGARCREAGACDGGLRCDEEVGLCYATAREGDICERALGFSDTGIARQRCEEGFTCVTPVRGGLFGTCARVGAALFAECAMPERGRSVCEGSASEPLACVNGRCQRLVGAGERCSVAENACPAGTSCVADTPSAAMGRCAPDGALGSACRSTANECDGELACILESDTGARRCKTVGRTPGAACGSTGACSYENPCVALDPARPGVGICTLPGSAGGTCVSGRCTEAGTTCVGASTRSAGRCVRSASPDAACDVAGRFTQCAFSRSCVPDADGGSMGTCRAAGTAAGAACRTAGAVGGRCDAGLECAGEGSAALCTRAAVSGAPCDPRYGSLRCGGEQGCLASSLTAGVCAPRVSAPAAMAPSLASLPGVRPLPARSLVRGMLEQYGLDCYRVTGAQTALFAQVTGPDGRCTIDVALDVYHRSDEGRRWRWVGTSTEAGPGGCPRIDGREASWSWATLGPAVTGPGSDGMAEAVVCVRQDSDRRAVPTYELSAAAVAR